MKTENLDKNYCIIHKSWLDEKSVNGKLIGIWELLYKSTDCDVVYETGIHIQCGNVCEALKIANDHTQIHKDMIKKHGVYLGYILIKIK